MSWEAQAWVWSIEGMAAGPKWVLMGIANYVNQDAKCWPSLETLSTKLGMAVCSVINHINDLIADGFMVRLNRVKKHYGVTVYKLAMTVIQPVKTALKKGLPRGKSVLKFRTERQKQVQNLELKQILNLDTNLLGQPVRVQPLGADAPDRKKYIHDPAIKQWTDRIYSTDKKKFEGLVKWVATAQKDQYRLEHVAEALRKFMPHIAEIANWWPYLTQILNKVEGKINAREFETLSERDKRSEAAYAKSMFGGRGLVQVQDRST